MSTQGSSSNNLNIIFDSHRVWQNSNNSTVTLNIISSPRNVDVNGNVSNVENPDSTSLKGTECREKRIRKRDLVLMSLQELKEKVSKKKKQYTKNWLNIKHDSNIEMIDDVESYRAEVYDKYDKVNVSGSEREMKQDLKSLQELPPVPTVMSAEEIYGIAQSINNVQDVANPNNVIHVKRKISDILQKKIDEKQAFYINEFNEKIASKIYDI